MKEQVLESNKFKKNIFDKINSPGRAFFEICEDVNVETKDGLLVASVKHESIYALAQNLQETYLKKD